MPTKRISSEKKTTAPKRTRAPRKTASKTALEITSDAIAARAYQLFQARGYDHGHDLEDWLAAEAELRGHA
jgi:hypothetical protein